MPTDKEDFDATRITELFTQVRDAQRSLISSIEQLTSRIRSFGDELERRNNELEQRLNR